MSERPDWYAALRDIASLGSTAERPGSLAGLAGARRIHRGQFFTPDALAAWIWRMVEPISPEGRRVSVLDNSIGSGRLVQFADPARHFIGGCDVDAGCVAELGAALTAGGFSFEVEAVGMESIEPQGFDVACINPPFSLSLQSPHLQPYACTSFGRFGPATSALSHAYALAQALDAARIVIAVLPTSFAEAVVNDRAGWLGEDGQRLRACYTMPAGLFREEGTEVRVSVLAFDAFKRRDFLRVEVDALDQACAPAISLAVADAGRKPQLRVRGLATSAPTITRPVTHDRRVRVTHDGRRLKLHFACALTEARVLNAVLHARIETVRAEGVRTPREVRYAGHYRLDLEAHLMQDDPMASFGALLTLIEQAGGEPELAPGIVGYLQRKRRARAIMQAPFGRMALSCGGGSEAIRACVVSARTQPADPASWISPVIAAGARIELRRDTPGANTWHFEIAGKTFSVSDLDARRRFVFGENEAASWQTIATPLAQRFPERAAHWRARCEAAGVFAWLNRDYQREDLVECLMKPAGATVAWSMALGKARLALALALASGSRHSLIVVQSYLIDEMEREIRKVGLDASLWQVIQTPAEIARLARINLITTSRLRMPLSGAQPRKSYGKALRRRIGTLIVDEGEFLSNQDTDQSAAVAAVSARRRYLLTGTPIGNYPRSILALMSFTAGDGTHAQPYGLRRGYLAPELVSPVAAGTAQRGIERFKDDFVVLDWATREWEESLKDGAKREIPRIAQLDTYRAMIAPHVKRRVAHEPDVARYITIPVPTKRVIDVPWDDAHLAHFLAVAEDFAQWYAQSQQDRRNNLAVLLAKIGACEMAGNFPQHEDAVRRYRPLTSKQRFAIAHLKAISGQGERWVCYGHHPGALELIGRALEADGLQIVRYHGGRSVARRTRELNEDFRGGSAHGLLVTVGAGRAGLNLPEANRVLFYDRDWTASREDQALHRTLRPDQLKDVIAEYLHLPGSLDAYQAQMVAHKADAVRAGLDFAEPELDDAEFLHLGTVIARFVEQVARLRGVKRHDLRETLLREGRRAA